MTMPRKNDLSAIKVQPKNTLTPQTEIPSVPSAPLLPKAKGGRKKTPEEKESELVGLKFTPSEKAKISQKAGRVPLATYIKDLIRSKTDLLDWTSKNGYMDKTNIIGYTDKTKQTSISDYTDYPVFIWLELEENEAFALAQFVKRADWSDIRGNALSDTEGEEIQKALEKLGEALAKLGYAPR